LAPAPPCWSRRTTARSTARRSLSST
jgi:hypothetical protein